MHYFPLRLRHAILAAGYVNKQGDPNVYAFARVFDPEDPERGERNLRRWLSTEHPTNPSTSSREALAVALGLPADFFGRGSRPRSVHLQMADAFRRRLNEEAARS